MKNNTLICIICSILMVFVLKNPDVAINSVSESTTIWLNSVFPTLFPFFIMTSIIRQTGVLETIIYKCSKKKDYNYLFIAIIGFICGYPSSSKLIGESSIVNPTPLYALSTAPSPIFLIGSVSAIFLGNSSLAPYIIFATYLSLLSSYILLNIFQREKFTRTTTPPIIKNTPLGAMLKTAIIDGMKSQAIILGIIITVSVLTVALNYMGIFSIIATILSPVVSIFNLPTSIIPAFLQGLMEMSSGTYAICQLNISIYHKLLMCGFITSFGGMSIILESISFINNKIKATSIIGVKLLHGVLTTIYLRLLLYIFPLYQATSATQSITHISTTALFSTACVISVTVLLILHRIAHRVL